MQRRQNEIKIIETPTEYLLSIPPKQRDRAKNIRNDWDGVRRCWVYPRNIDMYYALIREFADDLTSSSSFTNPQDDEQKWQSQEEIDYLRDTLLDKEKIISDKGDKIKSLKTKGERKDRENSELQEEIDRLRGIAKSINSLDERISNKDRENDELNRKNRELEKQVDTYQTTIDDLRQTLSEKEEKISTQEGKIELLEAIINKSKEQVDQLQDINTHPKIRDIAVEAAGDDPEFRKFNIDEYLPIALEEWLETRLNQALGRRNVDLYNLIDNHIDFEEEKLNPDELDYSDRDLAYVIRTQRNVLAHPKEMKKETGMARILCCFFAAALLPSKRPKPKQPAFK